MSAAPARPLLTVLVIAITLWLALWGGGSSDADIQSKVSPAASTFSPLIAGCRRAANIAPVSGRWVIKLRKGVSHPPCCGNEAGTGPAFPRAHGGKSFTCNRTGISSLVFGDDSRPSLLGGGGYACKCSRATQRRIAHLSWVPDVPAGCPPLLEWDAQAFCTALGNRTMLFLGDSTMAQNAVTVSNYIAWEGGGCKHQLVYGVSDKLVHLPFGAMNRGSHWADAVADFAKLHGRPPSLLIVSASPHVRGVANMTTLLTLMRDSFAASVYVNTTRLVWLTAGNEGCDDKVLTRMPSPGSLRFQTGPYAERYRDAAAWQDSTIRFWSGVPFASVVDVRPLWMRPDAMVGSTMGDGNCVHACLPGPLLLVARMLQELVTHVHPV